VISGFERYYQIARCFRDEDLRADRLQELTQLDVEMAFPDQEFLFGLMERMISTVWRDCIGVELKTPFQRMTYAEADRRFGSDKNLNRSLPELLLGVEPGAPAGAFVHARHAGNGSLPRLAGWWGNDPATRFRMQLEPDFVPVPSADAWHQAFDAAEHLVCRFVCKRYGEDPTRMDAQLTDEPGDAIGDHAGLARAGAGEHEQGAGTVRHRLALLLIQSCEVDHFVDASYVANCCSLSHGLEGSCSVLVSRNYF